MQSDKLGIPLANVLREQSTEMRVKRRQRAEAQAQKVPVKIMFPLVLCIFPSLFVVIIGPGAIQIARTLMSNAPAHDIPTARRTPLPTDARGRPVDLVVLPSSRCSC